MYPVADLLSFYMALKIHSVHFFGTKFLSLWLTALTKTKEHAENSANFHKSLIAEVIASACLRWKEHCTKLFIHKIRHLMVVIPISYL